MYLGIMQRLRRAIRRRRPIRWAANDWILQHDGAPAHRADPVVRFLRNNHTQILPHPPYSPDLAPSDYWLFARIKKSIKGRRFDDLDELCRQVDAVIDQIPVRDFEAAMDRMVVRWRQCVAALGDYFE